MKQGTSSQKNLTGSISDEIIETTLDLSIDYAEITMDEIMDGTLREIPLINTIYSLGKLGYSIREKFFVKKILTFLQEFHSQKVDEFKIKEFKTKFDFDEKYKNKVMETLLVYSDSFLNIEKSKIFARLFRNYIDGYYDWNYFLGLTDCLNAINISAIDFLTQMADINYEISEEPEERKIERDGDKEALLYSCGIAYENSSWSSSFNISQVGKDLFEFGIKNLKS